MLLAGLTGCGPASSDNAPNLVSRASVGGPSLSKQNPSTGTQPFDCGVTRRRVPRPLLRSMGQVHRQERGQSQEGTVPIQMPVRSSEPGHPVEGLVVPELMAQKLNSPNVPASGSRPSKPGRSPTPPSWSRLRMCPLILAFEDPDERVRPWVTTGRKMEGGLIGLLSMLTEGARKKNWKGAQAGPVLPEQRRGGG